MSEFTIITNNQPRDLLHCWDLTAKEKAEFAWIDAEKQDGAEFFRYKGWTYSLDQFMRWESGGELAKWDGYHADSYFSGILVRLVDDGEAVVVGRYFS